MMGLSGPFTGLLGLPLGRTPVNGRDSGGRRKHNSVKLEPVLKHGPNTAFGGNAHEWAISLASL